ncbi:TIGR00282 family metallophosphoesterase [Acidobacteriota bacterium]
MPDKVRIILVGDIIGRPGRKALDVFLPSLKERFSPSLVIGNGENAAGGIGITKEVGKELFLHFDVITSGNHIWDKKEGIEYLKEEPRLLRPANYPVDNPGRGYHILETAEGHKVAVLNLQGRVFMEPIECPFRVADECLEEIHKSTPVVIVDFHAEATSEKQALGWHLDGRISALIGTHTHVLTGDGKILPNGTAYLTDVGMAGGFESVIGIKKEQALLRFLTSRPHRFEPARGQLLFSAACIEIDLKSGKALSLEVVNQTGEFY